jgi:hypothetical protein
MLKIAEQRYEIIFWECRSGISEMGQRVNYEEPFYRDHLVEVSEGFLGMIEIMSQFVIRSISAVSPYAGNHRYYTR